MALDASTILCMSQYNKTDIYALLDESLQYRLVSFRSDQGSPEASYHSIGTASKQSLVEIRRPLDCYGSSVDSVFFAIMPGTKGSYPNPILNGIRINFGSATDLIWKPVGIDATYNETTAPTASLLFPYSNYLMHIMDGPTGQTIRAMGRTNYTNIFANNMTFLGPKNQINEGASLNQYRVNFFSLFGDRGYGHLDLQGLPAGVQSWKQFLVHENSFRDAAYATLVGDFTENSTVATKIISRWVGNGTVDLTLPTPDNIIRRTTSTPSLPLASFPVMTNTNDEEDRTIVKIITGIVSGDYFMYDGNAVEGWKTLTASKK
ncbi:hypothetical protein BGZ59_007765 [Podila verticillata]|nr:hypothetical protein BGZ59_007765 [Podila verticillata]